MIIGGIGALGRAGGDGRRVGGRGRDAAFVVMAQCWGALVGEVGVRVGGGGGIVERIAFAGDGVGAIARDVRQEA